MNERAYTDVGLLSKDSCLMVQDPTDSLFHLLIPTTGLPETKGAPATVEKTVLTDHSVTEVEGLQTNAQKTYTFNYHRDNLRQLNKYVGKTLTFIEVNPDYTGERFKGTMKYGRSAVEVNGIVQGQIFITVNEADDLPLDDVRDIIKKTAIITTPLVETVITGTNKVEMQLEVLPATATVTATTSSSSVATVTCVSNRLAITGVAEGVCFINLATSAEGEATSYRSIAVEVVAGE